MSFRTSIHTEHMKITLLSHIFTDQEIQQHFASNHDLLIYLIPDYEKWQSQGITFTITNHRHIYKFTQGVDIIAKGPKKVLTALVITGNYK